MESDDALRILTATATNRVPTLWLVFSSLPVEDRAVQVASTIAAAMDPDVTFAELLVARRGKQIVAAAWVQPAPGRIAVVWPPQLIEGEPEATAAALFGEVESRLIAGDLDLAQAIQSSSEGEVADRLRRHGFQLAAKLLFLVCDLKSQRDLAPLGLDLEAPAGEENQSSLEFEPFEESQATRLTRVIERTYVETQDIPLLNNLRGMTDVLAGYRQTGAYDPRNWYFVRTRGGDVGCLLLADHPQLDQVELLYMGVVPEARGQGLGKRVTEYAKRHTLHAGRGRLILGVDADNRPALLSYTSAGFQLWQERCVFLRSYRK